MSRITPLLKFVFSYEKFQCRVPIIPIRFVSIDNKSTPIFHAVLDSGADTLTIPKDLAGWLGVKLQPKVTPTATASWVRESIHRNCTSFYLRARRPRGKISGC